MKKIGFLCCFGLLPVGLVACSSKMIHKAVPAHIIHPDAASRSELKQVVTAALHNENILLAKDALTKNSKLIIENRESLRSGFDLQKPKVFHLKKSGANCILEYQGSNKRWVLKETQCAPVVNKLVTNSSFKAFPINI